MPIEKEQPLGQLSPESFKEIRTTNYLQLTLPKRKMGFLRIIGLFVMAASCIPLFIGYQFVYEPFQRFLEQESNSRYFDLFFAIAGLIPSLIGLALAFIGLAMIFFQSRSQIRIGHHSLRAREIIGPFFKTWTIARDHIQNVQIINAVTMRHNQKQTINTVFYGIIAKSKSTAIGLDNKAVKDIRLAPGYTISLLEQVCERIAQEYQIPIEAPLLNRPPAEPKQVTENNSAFSVQDTPIPHQPKQSKIEFEDHSEGLAVRIPPKGLIKGSKGLFFFAVFWNAFVSIFIVILLYAFFIEGDSEALIGLLFILIFVAVGVGVGLAALNMGKRKADILVMRSGLTIKRSGIFGEKVHEFDLNTVDRIISGPSGMSVNDVPVQELQIWSTGNKELGLLSQLDNQEIIWLASLLDRKLKQLR